MRSSACVLLPTRFKTCIWADNGVSHLRRENRSASDGRQGGKVARHGLFSPLVDKLEITENLTLEGNPTRIDITNMQRAKSRDS